jgi:hypothetical protein
MGLANWPASGFHCTIITLLTIGIVMLEVNQINANLADLAERIQALRGYL